MKDILFYNIGEADTVLEKNKNKRRENKLTHPLWRKSETLQKLNMHVLLKIIGSFNRLPVKN